MPSEEDFHKKELSDKITEQGVSKLRELKASLDKHIKGVKENELKDIGDLNEEKSKALQESMKDYNDGPPFGNLNQTEGQRVEQRVNKRLGEIEQRLDKIEKWCNQVDNYFRGEYKGRNGK